MKRGHRVVRGDKELVEKLGRNDLCPCDSGRKFQTVLPQKRHFDGSNRNYFFPAVTENSASARKGGIMSVIQWASFGWKKRASLCATCIWGTVRSGERTRESETFCRLITPNAVVPFPVRNCTDYSDRTAMAVVAEPKLEERKYGFVTIPLEEKKK